MSTTENATRLETSLGMSMERLVEGWTPLQVSQHRDLFEAALRAIEAFIASPRGQGMHADALRFWNYQRSTFHQCAQQLGSARPGDEVSCPRCPKCGAVEFSPYPMGSAALRCAGCRTLWHHTDLTGERFRFLSKRINQGE
jgi:hypothetical protein